jgi:bifunctional non-homologous end joining protein LigD
MRVKVGDHTLSLSNLDKELYPDGTTKAEVIDYYTRLAPVLLPHLAGREVTRIRFPTARIARASSKNRRLRGYPDG